MRVSKWGNSLAVRLPTTVVDALDLKEGDQIEIRIARERVFEVSRDQSKPHGLLVCANCDVLCLPDLSLIEKRPMPAKAFFDTNVLIYAVGHDDPRSAQAEELLASGGVVSVQILNEWPLWLAEKY